jgi:hypothetical protein
MKEAVIRFRSLRINIPQSSQTRRLGRARRIPLHPDLLQQLAPARQPTGASIYGAVLCGAQSGHRALRRAEIQADDRSGWVRRRVRGDFRPPDGGLAARLPHNGNLALLALPDNRRTGHCVGDLDAREGIESGSCRGLSSGGEEGDEG